MQAGAASLKESIFKVLDKMPEDKVAEVLDFALFVNSRKQPEKKNIVKRGSFEEFESLAGIVSLGGDAVIDCENYWD
jgi:hypothetical protein